MRDVLLHIGGKPRKLLPLPGIEHEGVGRTLQILIRGIAPGFQNHGKTSGSTQTRYDRRSTEVHLAFRIKRQRVPYHLHSLVYVRFLPFLPRFQDDRELAVRLIAAHTRTASGDIQDILYVRLPHKEVHGTFRHYARPFEGGTYRQFQFHCKIALVLLRHEAARHKTRDHPYPYQRDAEKRKHPCRNPETFPYYLLIEPVAFREALVYLSENEVFLLVRLRSLQENGAHHRAKRQRHNSGNYDRYRNSDGELSEKLSRNAGKETYRDEHCTEHQRHGDKGASDSLHRFLGSFIRRQMLFPHYPVDIFHDDDGVIHDNTDGQDKAQQCHHVQGESENQHYAERSHQRDRYGNGRDKCRSPALQRKEDHEYHQQQCLEQCPVDMMDGLRYVGGHIEWYVVCNTFREGFGNLLHLLLHVFGHFQGVGAREHIDIHHGSIASVDTALRIVGLRLKGNPGHILQSYDGAVLSRSDDYVLELADRRKPSCRSDRDSHIHILDGLLSQHACSGLPVLVL